MEEPFKLLNVSNPYSNRKDIWEELESEVLMDSNLILVGYVNMKVLEREVWGSRLIFDPLSRNFGHIFQVENLINFIPNPFLPTWRNGWSGYEGLAKNLDCFMIAKYLIDDLGWLRSRITNIYISNHMPICLDINSNLNRIKYPLKFNHPWDGGDDFKF